MKTISDYFGMLTAPSYENEAGSLLQPLFDTLKFNRYFIWGTLSRFSPDSVAEG